MSAVCHGKGNFQNNQKYRLLNSSKNEIGIIPKHSIENINIIRNKAKVNQGRNK